MNRKNLNHSISENLSTHRIIQLALLFGLCLLSYKIIAFFISPVIWAAILVYSTKPIYNKLCLYLPNKPILNATIMTSILILIIVLPLVMGTMSLQREIRHITPEIQHALASGQYVLSPIIQNIPILSEQLQQILDQVNSNPQLISNSINNWLQSHIQFGKEIFSSISLNIARLSFALITTFFLYLNGEELLAQIRKATHLIIGARVDHYLNAIGKTTQAVVYGIGATAIAQGLLAGLAYFVISYFVPTLPSPLLLTVITVIIAFIPFGTPFAWSAVVIWLFANGHTIPAISLAVWGTFVVSWIDNIIRPAVISNATQIPFLFIMFGVIGGLSTFGMVGLFVGPVVLAVFLAVWREWLASVEPSDDSNMP